MASLQGTTVNNFLRTLEQVRATGWYGAPTGSSYTGLATEMGVSSGQGYILCYNRDSSSYGVLNLQGSASNLQISGSNINVTSGALQQGGNQVLHAGNYNSYSPTLTGTGASGSWGISVTGSSASCTGNAATVTNGAYLNAAQSFTAVCTFAVPSRTTSYTTPSLQVYTGDNTPPGIAFHRGGYSATYLYENDGELYTNPWTTRGQTGKLLAAGNYTDYTVTKTGTGASGSWGISITGSSGSVAALGVKTGALDDNIVTFAKMQQVTGPVAIGRTTASLGNITTLSGADLVTIIGANTITNATNATTCSGNAGSVTYIPGRTDATAYPVLWGAAYTNGSGTIAYSCANVTIQSSTGTLAATSFSGAGTGLTGTAASLSIGGNAANVTGTVAVGNGGTGATSFTAGRVLLGNGTTDITTSANLSYNTSTNRLGVGTTGPAYTLDVGGACHASSFPTSSDVRFKKNIQPLTNALQTILSLRGVKYEWNNFIHSERPGYELNTPVIGMIAQEVENVIPEIVGKWALNENFQDARSLEYQRIIPYLIEAVKELENKNKLLEARILALENK